LFFLALAICSGCWVDSLESWLWCNNFDKQLYIFYIDFCDCLVPQYLLAFVMQKLKLHNTPKLNIIWVCNLKATWKALQRLRSWLKGSGSFHQSVITSHNLKERTTQNLAGKNVVIGKNLAWETAFYLKHMFTDWPQHFALFWL